MVRATRSREDRAPGAGAWAVGLLSLLLCAFLSWLCLFAGLGYFQTGNLERAQDKLLSSQIADARRSLTMLARPPGLLGLVRSRPQVSGRRSVAVSLSLLEVLESLELRKCAQAHKALAEFIIENERTLAQHSRNVELFSRLKEMSEELNRCAAVTRQQHTSREHLRETRLRKANAQKQYQSQAVDFAAIFALEPLKPEDPKAVLQPYERGVLQGLPRVRGIDDGISDLFALKSELDKLNTRVRVGGADTHQAFVQRLRELKEATLWAHADWQKAAQQESLLQSAISDQEEELEALLGTSKKKLVYSVHSLSTTEIDQRFVKSMSWLSSRTVQLADIIDRSLDNIFLAIGL